MLLFYHSNVGWLDRQVMMYRSLKAVATLRLPFSRLLLLNRHMSC